VQQRPPDLSALQFVRLLLVSRHAGIWMLTSCILEFNRVLQARKLEMSLNGGWQDRTVRHSMPRFPELLRKCGQPFLLEVDAASREAQETYGFLFCN
jgi:hypothetical protein